MTFASAIGATLLMVLLSPTPRADEFAAGGVAGLGSWRSVVIVRSDAVDLAIRLRRSGALLTLDARSLAT